MADDRHGTKNLLVEYAAPAQVREVIAALGRTEDLRFSPSCRRLAIASVARNAVAVIDLEIEKSGTTARVALTRAVEVAAPCLNYPHGLEFLDEDTLLVGSREGGLAIFDLRPDGAGAPFVLPADANPLLEAPGSIAILARDPAFCELLVCNNFRHCVSRLRLDRGAGNALASGTTLIAKWLDVPDGICVSSDGQWIAVSNHNAYAAMLYENTPHLDPETDPDGILRGVRYPHGLRFAPDGEHLFVADAGGPYVHIYARGERGWRGVRNPIGSIRVMDEPAFRRGRYNAREGGPKGLDIDRDMKVLALTSEWQPLAFFDLPALLEAAGTAAHLPEFDAALAPMRQAQVDAQPVSELSLGVRAAQDRADIHYELDTLMQMREVRQRLREATRRSKDAEVRARRAAHSELKATKRLLAMQRSLSWRVTAPLRWLRSAWRRAR